ncbi:MAG: tRNA (N6-threonylcarbamoyladenosine(37)-N6)-methyltransferase TrmO [Halobacteriovoraceae bacterium]|jgi:tRNA (adenine37-N6)-methyltransferase|nr:tRNA (N6-threonylcarbamoyladenosine(37)-N6)-methyltransferase TrmO [Halobacteriovoraceae bacterium]MBT5096088.1 tRNA (N6-threonylcarbamoyladenosine(37)-N6)-methyltransferase TrmO [Halobacteriovoraceae bacterium]
MTSIELNAIGCIATPFKEKFGIPRQSGLCLKATGVIELAANQDSRDGIMGLEVGSSIWLIFQFNGVAECSTKYSVRPPRLGGQKKAGVWATRSPHRPNRLGLSLVALEKIENSKEGIKLHVRGVDLLDGTPILDIKPYLAYADRCDSTSPSWLAEQQFKKIEKISFSDAANEELKAAGEDFKILLEELLEHDPRPAHQRELDKEFSFQLADYDISFRPSSDGLEVTQLKNLNC